MNFLKLSLISNLVLCSAALGSQPAPKPQNETARFLQLPTSQALPANPNKELYADKKANVAQLLQKAQSDKTIQASNVANQKLQDVFIVVPKDSSSGSGE